MTASAPSPALNLNIIRIKRKATEAPLTSLGQSLRLYEACETVISDSITRRLVINLSRSRRRESRQTSSRQRTALAGRYEQRFWPWYFQAGPDRRTRVVCQGCRGGCLESELSHGLSVYSFADINAARSMIRQETIQKLMAEQKAQFLSQSPLEQSTVQPSVSALDSTDTLKSPVTETIPQERRYRVIKPAHSQGRKAGPGSRFGAKAAQM